MKKAIAIICLAAAAIMLAGCSGKAITLPNVDTSRPSATTDGSESSVPETSEVNSSQAETTTTNTTAPETTTTKAPETKPSAVTTTVKEPKPDATTKATTTKNQDSPAPTKYITFSDGTYTFKLDASIWKKTDDTDYDVEAVYDEGDTTILAISMMKSTKAELGEGYESLSLQEMGDTLTDEYEEIGFTITSSGVEKVNGVDAYHIVFSLVYDQHIYIFESGENLFIITIGCGDDPNGNAQEIAADALKGFSLN